MSINASHKFHDHLLAAVLSGLCMLGLNAPAQATTPSFAPPPQWKSLRQDDGTVMMMAPGATSARDATIIYVPPTRPAEADLNRQAERVLSELESQLGLKQGQIMDRRGQPAPGGEMRIITAAYGGAQVERLIMLMAQRSARGVDFVMLMTPDTARFQQFSPVAVQVFNSMQTFPANNGPVGGLQASAPLNWGTSTHGGNTLYTSPRNQFSGKINQLEVLSAQSVSGDWRSIFLNLWGQQVRGRFNIPFSPLPLRVRTPNGLVVLFDFATDDVVVNGDRFRPGLYVITDGRTAVPILAMLRDFNDIEKEMRAWLPTLRLSGAQRAPTLFTQAEVTGRWESSSSSMASYVNAYGNYVGDASIVTGETLVIQPNGQCTSAFVAAGGGVGRPMRRNNAGQCTVNDDMMTYPGASNPRGYRITGIGQSTDGHRFMLLGVTSDTYPSPSASSQYPAAGNVYVAK